MKIPDYLSKIQPTQGEEIELDVTIYTVNISAQKQIDLQEDSEKDEELKMLKQVLINGWPEDVKHTPKPIKHYWSMKIVTKRECIVIPKSMQGVAVTDLLSLANQCPCQAIRPHTD